MKNVQKADLPDEFPPGGRLLHLDYAPEIQRSAEPRILTHNHLRDASSARPRQALKALADSVSCGFNPDTARYPRAASGFWKAANYAKGSIRLPSLSKYLGSPV